MGNRGNERKSVIVTPNSCLRSGELTQTISFPRGFDAVYPKSLQPSAFSLFAGFL